MDPTGLHYFPLALPIYAILIGAFVVVFALIELKILVYAYQRIGVHPRYVGVVLLASLLGAAVNIPVAQLPAEEVVSDQIVSFYGVRYVVPVVRQWPGCVIAVNVGGAVIPSLLSVYLLSNNRLFLRGLIGVAVVSLAVHAMAYPVRGLGIAVPTLAPPIIAACAGLALSPRAAPALAYISGSLGTLIGGDLLNLGKIQGLGAPVASIGGAGTFDGIFVTGILAVLLAAIGPRSAETRHVRESDA